MYVIKDKEKESYIVTNAIIDKLIFTKDIDYADKFSNERKAIEYLKIRRNIINNDKTFEIIRLPKVAIEVLMNTKPKTMKETKTIIPEGYEIDKENSSFECIKFRKIENKLPKTWKEYIEKNVDNKVYYITSFSHIEHVNLSIEEDYRNSLPTKELAKAFLAYMQLISLRDEYRQGWIPDWDDGNETKYLIFIHKNEITKDYTYIWKRTLAFQTEELRDEFLNNFKDLILQAKELI